MKLCLRESSVFLAVVVTLVSQAHADSKLSSIFQSEMLNAQIAYLETITGPAMHVIPTLGGVQIRDYRVNGCKVTAYAKDAAVLAYSLDLNPKCNINLGAFLGNGYSSTEGLTIAKFIKGVFGTDMRVQASCLDLCGNAADPTVDFTFEGPHAVNFVSIVFTIVLAATRSLVAAERWEKTMRNNEGEKYILNTRFNRDNKYDSTAIQNFAKVPIDQITVGSYQAIADLYKPSCSQ
jgi:hypothetical protein